MKENLPLELYEKHRDELGLGAAVFFENENDLFRSFPSPVASAVVFLPKSKALINMTLAFVSGMVAEGGTVVLAGANDAGIRSAKDSFEANVGPVEQKIVGNHSALYVGKNARLGAGKKLEDYLSFSPLEFDGTAIETAKLPGVFSAGELDEGTKLLLEHIPYDNKKVLDIGSGAGVIGAIYKKRNPAAEITMSDASMLAVRASEETLKKNGFDGKVILSDVFDGLGVADAFDIILCNPPFHKGVATDYSFIEKFCVGAKRHLNPGGKIYVVANSFLPYSDKLSKIGPTRTLTENKKFAVYETNL